MRIGIIGAGKIGATAARLWIESGHEVALSNSRGPASLRELVAELGPGARAMKVADAARFGEVVLLAVPWHLEDALPAAKSVEGKIVIDAMNPYRPEGGFYEMGNSTSSEEVLKRLRGARLVKALNSISYKDLAERPRRDLPLGERLAVYIAGDDPDAKSLVANLIVDLGFAPVDTGSLREGGRLQQPESAIFNLALTAREARAFLAGELKR